MGQEYTQKKLRKSLDKLREKLGRFNLSQRYYRDTSNSKEHNQINKVFKKFKGKVVLDVGCHLGYYSVLISSFADKVIGIDISEAEIGRANYFKKVVGSQNTEFKLYSAFYLDDKFMEENKIDAIFFHKMSEPRISKQQGLPETWNDKKFKETFLLFEKHCKVIITNDRNRIEKLFKNSRFSVKKYPSYRHNHLYVIKNKETKE